MATTIGVKVDDALRARLKAAAESLGRTPHWVVKSALLAALDRIERGEVPNDDAPEVEDDIAEAPLPFLDFAQGVQPQGVLRARITAAYRRPEPECLPYLIEQASLSPDRMEKATALARDLVVRLRAKQRRGGVEALIHEYSLSAPEGVALMCLAEALLRIPDRATRDALIRDKIASGDWQSHVGHSPSLFVNAATWGLVVTGRLTATTSEQGLSSALTRLIGRSGEPLIRKGVDIAMRMMGEQFVTGQTIAEALANARKMEARGFRYSYDMLGEAATTAEDAARYLAAYETAIHAIGKASAGRGIYDGPGISIKLSALHPRYARAQFDRVMAELLPRLKSLALLARRYDIGLNIDAEEAERLEISLDLLEALCFDPDLTGWNGIGFVVQAYGKRCPHVIDHLIDLGRRSSRRLMVRLVKGAYWDSEIKRAQVDGLEGFPVFTRKIHTDVSYLACARKLLAAPDAVFPQFATHNAHTLATVMTMAGDNYYAGQYEFQCLHGMGEPLYEELVGNGGAKRPCRIYAPVGTHETLLAYLVRRLLENGANTSFVNRIADETVPVEDLIADPVAAARALDPVGAPHPAIRLPRDMFGAERANSTGLDLTNEQYLASVSAALLASLEVERHVGPAEGPAIALRNPADHRDVVGGAVFPDPVTAPDAFGPALAAAPIWAATPPAERAACLARAADLLEARMTALLGLIVREAGKSLPNAVAEVREAVDFLRYYGLEAVRRFDGHEERPLGPVVCISPWNFPLAIFTGQVAAALAAGNVVLAKPAEETPLIAAAAVALLHEAGVPEGALQLVPGGGPTGAALIGDPRLRGVIFTGSTEVARLIHRRIAGRLTPEGRPLPLIAETGGQNAMIVDSSALAEQVVIDVVTSAFDSAGQRCSALRLLCLQDEIADRLLAMLKGAMEELTVGNPGRLSTDVGPVITQAAKDGIEAHVAAMAERGFPVHRLALGDETRHGTFVAPTLIEIDDVAALGREVFGPVLHVLRYRRKDLGALIEAINATGYGLTFGLHTRLDETIANVTGRIEAGNIYVNRNIVGAVVGVQPFGGRGLSGTGPKAGGPLYLRRLLARRPDADGGLPPGPAPAPAALALADHLAATRHGTLAEKARALATLSPLGLVLDLPGPVGERNTYGLRPRGRVLARAASLEGAFLALAATLATGNRLVVEAGGAIAGHLAGLPRDVTAHVEPIASLAVASALGAALFEGDGDTLAAFDCDLAQLDGPILQPRVITVDGEVDLCALLEETAISTNTAAAGGNASLMAIG
ncbi:trifunctional transcriptional regulator/proline dehydrogenase/L-glutamate gamma-semialdehyde dehydrogenase [Zavarzinia compransoris]|uniref:trifunctional transcriptional regulator/proline dehydrogenase/L-glutamate gamma-semialdehyde dehydrogenase n=1 Tax=Zavarzinia marina TaxID=2911065 RepID=UPI001F29DFAB|nr:trifunctional transcriptional regulator/proline dehydrogenase/L-glutamate gamma-semialdehyde dehydrogenase [Zavarzinia marina]MCF4165648.1 trifunctional transcriptional regulator/proline dehydrogenase/L-glutamate gamma-semialdehyde dehydrogenase [Zavarzinia marina]